MFSAFGAGGAFGVQAAVDDINKLGGIYIKEFGRRIPVKLVVADAESDPIKVGTLAEDMALRDKVNFFVSSAEPPPMRSPIAIVAERYKIPHVGMTIMEPWMGMRMAVDPPWQYTWMSGFAILTEPPQGDPRYGKPGYTVVDTWMEWLVMFGDQTNKRVGIFATDEPDGRGWYKLFGPALEAAGYDVLGEERDLGLFPLGTTDLTSTIKEWKDYDVEILWGNTPAPDFATLWRQASQLDFKPKMVGAGRAALFYTDVISWGGDLPWGIGIEMWWHPAYDPEVTPGVGDTTPQSLADRWATATGEPLNPNIGWSYSIPQILFDAIERAGTLDADAVNKAIGETDTLTINHLAKFDKETQFSWGPLFFGQWYKTDTPQVWDLPVVFSKHDFIKATADPIFPIPYE